MEAHASAHASGVLGRLHVAINAHDADAMAACHAESYRSEQPVHPNRGFGGRDQVRTNWTALFRGVPNLRADLLRSADSGDTAWSEWHMYGDRADGSRFDLRGVIISGIENDRIVWSRLYLEEPEGAGAAIDETVQRLATGEG